MAFLRFSRDKRGYEYFALVQPTNRRGKSGSRVLYAFRSPPNVKVGREPFDETVQRALEAQNPDVTFDWPKLMATPMPAVEPERWRERRNAERAAKLAAQSEATAESAEVEQGETPAVVSLPASEPVVVDAAVSAAPASSETPESIPPSARRRRRRRRGRRREGHGTQEAQGPREAAGQEAQEAGEDQVGQEAPEAPDEFPEAGEPREPH